MTVKAEERDGKLFAGVRAKDVAMVREALAAGFDPNEVDSNGWPAFNEAVATGNSSITLAFLRRGAKADLQDKNGNSSLHVAAKKGHTKIVQMLLDNGADISLNNIDGNTPEQLATSACKELLQRKRIQLMMTVDSTRIASFKDGSLLKMNPTRSASPKKPQGSTYTSRESLSTSEEKDQPGTGEVKLSFEYNRRLTSLKVNILEIKDLKLPTENNYSHIYVKCCLMPDKDKETKGKTSLFKIDSLSEDQGYGSRGSSASSQSSTASSSSIESDSQIADKIMSVLKKRPHLHKKQKNEVKCFLNSDIGDSVGRISIPIYESLSYDSLVLRKLNNNIAGSQIHVRVCAKNRWTSKGTTIAEAFVPLPVAMKKTQVTLPFYLDYKIEVPVTPEEKRQVQLNQSWELKEGREYTGRSLAWDMGLAAEATAPQTMYKAPSVPDFSTTAKKHRKHHSKAARFLKGELNLFRSKPNDRYNKNAKQMESTMVDYPVESTQTSMENPCCDKVEYIGRNRNESNSLSNNTGYEHWNSRSVDNIFEVTQARVTDESSAARPSLKYSRAFGEQSAVGRTRKTHEQDVSLEDVDDDFEEDFSHSKMEVRTKRY